MDSLERQMEHLREEIQSTLDQTSKGSGRKWTVLEKLRRSLPGFPGRTPTRGPGGPEIASNLKESPQIQEDQASTLRDWSGDVQGARRPWWRIFGG